MLFRSVVPNQVNSLPFLCIGHQNVNVLALQKRVSCGMDVARAFIFLQVLEIDFDRHRGDILSCDFISVLGKSFGFNSDQRHASHCFFNVYELLVCEKPEFFALLGGQFAELLDTKWLLMVETFLLKPFLSVWKELQVLLKLFALFLCEMRELQEI